MKYVFPLLLLLGVTCAHAELYKWVGPDGKVTYSDIPPPPKAAGQVEKKSMGNGAGSVSLPYEVAEVAKNHPVTLFTTNKCQACDDGRALLSRRGIPYTEKTVNSNDDLLKLQQAGGDKELPLMLLGRTKYQGFLGSEWDSALTAVGYPTSNMLPSNYVNPPPQTAAPLPEPKKTVEKTAAPERPAARPRPAAPVNPDTPPGFRF